MMAKVAELEKQLSEIPNQEAYEKRIAELEVMLDVEVDVEVGSEEGAIWLKHVSWIWIAEGGFVIVFCS
jgi:hypothetical protein